MDQYIKKKQIGEGSFGKALLVQGKADGKDYVVKEINISKMKRKEREESKKEVDVLQKMKHPNIVSYVGSFEERGNLFIVMEYCDGGDLFKAINSRRGVLFPEDEVMDWFVQICLALKHIHDRKILHRDIKSQNIFLTRKGIIKMGDFGIARVLNNTMELARTCIGTPYYLSPEICENAPYNNKSDIWALGCVLYEMLTLKHAFEAGNMKNLVLKIIRGSYPPVSPRYSYEIRNLQAQLFKRNARDRPSINSILKKPFVQKRIQKFLSDAELNDEFSHTVLHRNQQRPPSGAGQPFAKLRAPINAAAKKPPAGKPISNPAAKYGPSVGVKRPPSGNVRKQQERDKNAAERELEQKKRDLIEKERERRLKDRQVKVQQQQLNNKQRLAHIHKAREAGWKNTLLSSGSSNGSNGLGGGGGGGGKPYENGEPPAKEFKYQDPSLFDKAKGNRGNYDHYHQYLDNLGKGDNAAQVGQGGAAMFRDHGHGGAANYREEREKERERERREEERREEERERDRRWEEREKRREEDAAIRRQIRDRPVSASAARRAADARNAGAEAAERARMVNDFLQRKREAAANKARAAVQLGWVPPGGVGDARRHDPIFPANAQNNARNKDEQAYLEQLKAIRMQNYQERLNIRNRPEGSEDPQISADARRKKIEALKAQADQRAAKLKEQLEKQRREAYEKEKKAWDDHLAKKRGGNERAIPNERAVPSERAVPNERAVPPSKPVQGPAAPVVPLTAVLRDVGVDVTRPEKEPQPQAAVDEKQAADAAAAAPRRQWGGETKGSALANLPLEQTASNMEATSAADVVIRNVPEQSNRKKWGAPQENVPAAEANRKKWGAPGETVVNALHMAEIKAGTMTIAPSDNKGETRVLNPDVARAAVEGSPMGVTIIKDRPQSPRGRVPIIKDTMVIKEGAGDITEADDLETIDAKNEQDEKNVSEEQKPHEKAQNGNVDKPQAWTKDQEIKSETQLDGPVVKKQETSPSSKGSSESQTTPTSPSPNKEAPPTSQATPPKSTSPSSASPPAKTSPKSPSGAPSSSSLSPSALTSAQKSPRKSLDEGGDSKMEKEEKADENEGKKEDVTQEEKKVLDDVELDDDEGRASAKEVMIQGLSTGFFDTAPKLLRTCSDPDLRLLFRTTLALNPFFEADQQRAYVSQSVDTTLRRKKKADIVEDDDEEDDDIDVDEEENEELMRQLKELTAKYEDDDDDGDEDEEDDEGDGDEGDVAVDEEEEYQNLVESMKSVLEARDAALTPEDEKETKSDNAEVGEKTSEKEDKSSPSSPEKEDEDEAEEEEEEEDKESTPLNENWDSGEGSESEETDLSVEERESVFSRLEESRLQLEKELGCDTFLQAYKSIQAIHEDEDENIEEGTKRVTQILGDGKGQIYTKILHLVMADSAYTEGQD